MKVIDLEQHFETHLWIEALKNNAGYPRFDEEKGLGYWEESWIPNTKTGANEKLLDLGEGRLALMDKCGIDYAQLSLTSPGSESFDVETSKKIAEDANNQAAEAISKYPERFGAYMTLAPKDAEWSLKEIDRCLEMGLWGWHTHSTMETPIWMKSDSGQFFKSVKNWICQSISIRRQLQQRNLELLEFVWQLRHLVSVLIHNTAFCE